MIRLGRDVVPDLTRNPETQTTAQKVLGVLLLVALFLMAGLVPQ